MVIQATTSRARREGALLIELLVAITLLGAALLPLAYSIVSEQRLARACYQRAIAMELVDGEMEVLAAGEWRSFKPGTQEYVAHGGAVTNLPPGRLLLTVQPGKVRLEWQPASSRHGGPVVREVNVP
jgi:hypothetical protein